MLQFIPVNKRTGTKADKHSINFISCDSLRQTGEHFMQRNIIHLLAAILLAIWIVTPVAVLAASGSRPAFIPPTKINIVSNRLIVKLKPARIPAGISINQINTELMRPLSTETLNQLQRAAGVSMAESHAISTGAHVLILQGSPDRPTINQAINNIRGLSNVDYVEEDQIQTINAVPNDTEYPKLWALQPVIAVTSPAPGASGNYGADFENAWNLTAGSGVVVAVIDTGITPHTDIVGTGGSVSAASGNLASPGYDFISDCRVRGSTPCSASNAYYVAPSANATDLGDFISSADIALYPALFPGPVSKSSWHGTHVSGIVAALGNNATGVIGGAYGTRLLPVRAIGKGGGYTSDISEGMRWAAGIHPTIVNPNPAKVLNLSLGSTGSCSTTQQNAIDAVVAHGAVIVVSAGNDSTDVASASPANCNNVISVAAIGRDGSRASYSNYSSPVSNSSNPVQITLAAPGADAAGLGSSFDPGIYSTINSGTTTATTSYTYDYKQGTSMAAPHVAAAAALILSRNAALTPAQVKNILIASVTPFPSFYSTDWIPYDCAILKNCGAGILNANLAALNSINPFGTTTTSVDYGALYKNDAVSRTVTLTNSSGTTVTLGTTIITGVNATAFSVTSNSCLGSIASGVTCQVVISFTPKTVNAYSAALLIPALPTSAGAIVIVLNAIASLPMTAASALAATKSTSNSNGTGGGCSMMPADGNPDISLLLTLLLIIAYSLMHRASSRLGKV